MFKKAINNSRARKGFVAVTFAAMATVLVGFAGMAIDAGYMQWNKRRLQMAADAAAMGALRELEKSRTGDTLVTAGRYTAGLNGFTDGTNGVTVTISNPPTSGAFSGNTNAVQSRITRTFPTLFMRIFGQNSVSITALATAHTTVTAGSIGGCIFALNPSIQKSININGTTLDVNLNCSVVDDSSNGTAYFMGGGAKLKMGSGAKVGVVGGYSLAGTSQILDTRYSPSTVEYPISILNHGDPFAGMDEPSLTNTSSPVLRVNKGGFNATAGSTVAPGIYCGGINMPSSGTVTFQSGIYIIAGGGFNMSNNATTATGSGVMFYLTQSSATWGCQSGGPNQGYGGVNITGGNVNFSAPTSGRFCGMLFFLDRSTPSNIGSKIVGNANGVRIDGALYFRNTDFQYAGSSSSNGYTVLVADTISINGTSTIGNDYSSLSQPNPFAPYTTGGGLAE